jgi:hypothetical protein
MVPLLPLTMRLIVAEDESEQLKYKLGLALDTETEGWYQNLPPAIRFDRDIIVDLDLDPQSLLAPLVEDNVAWLRSSYMAIPMMAYWELVVSAATVTDSELTDERCKAINKWQVSFMKYVASAYQYMNGKFHPLVWTQSQTYQNIFPLY